MVHLDVAGIVAVGAVKREPASRDVHASDIGAQPEARNCHLVEHVAVEHGDHLREHGAISGVLRLDQAHDRTTLIHLHAGDDLVVQTPRNLVTRPFAHLVVVRHLREQVAVSRRGNARMDPGEVREHLAELFARDALVRAERAVAVTLNDSRLARPAQRHREELVGRHVGEAVAVFLRRPRDAPQHRDHLPARHRIVGSEHARLVISTHKPMLEGVPQDVVVRKPLAWVDIAETVVGEMFGCERLCLDSARRITRRRLASLPQRERGRGNKPYRKQAGKHDSK